MTGLVKAVRGKVDDACVTSGHLQKEGCAVKLRDAPFTRLIIDFDKPGSPLGQDQKRCDYLFVAEVTGKPGLVVPLELMRGKVEARKVVEQLQAGACAAERLVPSSLKISFHPVLAFGGGLHKSERTAMKRKVVFHGYSKPIFLIRCGDQLTKALGAAKPRGP